jgi:hypothetical protein
VVNHYARMAGVPSQHGNPSHAFRPAREEWSRAEEVFTSRGIVPGEFLRACLRWLASDPDAALAALDAHWPVPRPLGRPRRESGTASADGDQPG